MGKQRDRFARLEESFSVWLYNFKLRSLVFKQFDERFKRGGIVKIQQMFRLMVTVMKDKELLQFTILSLNV